MGTWGTGIWDNDGALDFLLELEKLSPKGRWRLIEKDIRAGDKTSPGEALPACEMLAFLLGQGHLDSHQSALKYARPGFIADAATPELVKRAVRYIERLTQVTVGFFRAADERKWKASLRNLAHRLRTATIQFPRSGWSLADSKPKAPRPSRARPAARRKTARRAPRRRARG